MKQYIELLKDVMVNGVDKGDRTGTGTRSVFGRQMRFDLQQGFPLISTKKINTRAVWHELLWMISGSTNIKPLNDVGVHIWDEWADDDGELGPIYGKQWRNAEGIDQLQDVINLIRHDPDSRRMVVNSWTVSDLSSMALSPCHCLFQFYVADGKLNLQLYQRSADIFLGVPFNIASYAMLVNMIARLTGLKPGEFVHTFGDLHLYNNHVMQAYEQINRVPYSTPFLNFSDTTTTDDIDQFTFQDLDTAIRGYSHYDAIKAPISI